MKKCYSPWSLLPCLIITLTFTVFSYGQSFNASGLSGENLDNPTSLDFGPNGKLYVAQQDGTILEYDVARDDADAGQGSYSIANTETIELVKTGVPNHNDDGSINTANTRQVTGILATGTAQTPILYVSSSDTRHGGAGGGTDTNLDTNSGVLSRLVWTGTAWDKVDLVRGLPRCEENHSTNGMDIFERDGNTYLLLQQGGNANKGAPSNNFAGTSETYLTAALLVVNLTQLEAMETANGGPYIDTRQGSTKYVYDLPTLNDPDRTDITNTHPDFPYPAGHPLYNASIDIGDPFGGNNGLNQAFSEVGGPVQIFSPGFRNAYDVVITTEGKIYTGDNGPNTNWGGQPVIYNGNGTIKNDQNAASYNPSAGEYVTNDFNEGNSTGHGDAMHYIGTTNDTNGNYYGGHPVPIRAFPSRAGVKVYTKNGSNWVTTADYGFGDLLDGVSGYFNPAFSIADFPDDTRQGAYWTGSISNPNTNILDIVSSSTNGICEYTASNFDGAMQGDILTCSYSKNINRYQLNANGDGLVAKNNSFLSNFGSIPLDVIAQGDDDIFPGTIWSATYGSNNITVFEPSDFAGCLQPTDPGYVGTEDYDSDGFTNDDEIANGTDICSGGSKPEDNDGDLISDLIDPDDDNDGIADTQDAFAIDANNGNTTDLPIIYPFWNNDPGTGFYGLGFTGLMLDPSGNTDYIDQFDGNNLTFGGAGGKATVDAVTEGNANGPGNTQQNAFQLGLNVDSGSAPFTAHTKIETPFAGITPVGGLSYGMFIGNGDQDHYLEVAIMEGMSDSDDIYGFEVVLEDGPTNVTSQKYDVASVLDTSSVDIYISVDPAANTAQPYYSINGGESVIALGMPLTLPNSFLDANDATGLAVGLISTSAGPGLEFTATWDFLNVTEDSDANLAISENPVDFGILQIGSGQAQLIPTLINQGGPSAGALEITNISITGTDAGLFENNTNLPLIIGPGAEKTLPVNFYPNNDAGTKTANLVIEHTGENSPFIVPLRSILTEDTEPTYNVIARVNAGGTTVSATDGEINWQANTGTGAVNGTNYSVNTGSIPSFNNTFSYENRHSSIPDYIDEATFNSIYLKERYDASGAPEMEFQFPVADGDYVVNIFTGNGYEPANSVGARQFDISLEDALVGDDIDPVALFGGSGTDFHAGMLSYEVTVSDGTLNLLFEHGANENPVLQAIEIWSVNQDLSLINVVPIANQVYQVNESSVLAVSATGGDTQENFLYAISGQPTGIDIEPTNGQILGTITEADLTGGPNNDGVHNVTVTVSKPSSQAVSIEFSWSVVNLQWNDKDENENYTARHECSLVQAGDKFYLMGGRENGKTIDVYDYTNDTWTQIIDSPPVEFNHFQATEYQGLIWVIGAFTDNGFPNETPAEYVWAFDPANEEWIQGAEIPAERKRGSAGLVVYNDKFYISGGNTNGHNGGYTNWFDEYDPATGTWTTLADAPHARDHFHSAVIGDKMYLIGGRLSGNSGGVFNPVIAEVDVFDFTTGAWSTLPSDQNLPTPRAAAVVANFNGKLIVAGGEVNQEMVYGTLTTDALAVTEQYDPIAQTWTRLPDLNHKRHGTQAIVSGEGVYVLGGSQNLGNGNQKNMEFLGEDYPMGIPTSPSVLNTTAVVDIETDASADIKLQVNDGTTGIIIRSMTLDGPDASNYTLVSGALENGFLAPDSEHIITISLNETGQNTSALLTIEYGAASTLSVVLKNGELSSGFENPGIQYNMEGDMVTLQIEADNDSGDFTYAATGLPPALSINSATGVISGTVTSGENSGPFVEENGLVVIEAESGDYAAEWDETTANGAIGILANTNSLGGQNGGTIPYQVQINTPGVYRFDWHSYYSGESPTDENDNWLRFPNNDDVWFFGYKGNPGDEANIITNLEGLQENVVFPKGSVRITTTTTPEGNGGNGYFKIYRSGGLSETYDWQARTSDFDAHDIYVRFVNAGTYSFEISERSAGHAIDKMALYKVDGPSYSDGELTAAAESQRAPDANSGAVAGSPYQVAVSVTNTDNIADKTTEEFTWIIDNSGAPVAGIYADPLEGESPLRVLFSSSPSADDVGITGYLWDFDDADGSTSSQEDVGFTFTEPGTYNVTLTVTDADAQTGSDSVEITVRPRPTHPIFATAGANGSISPEGQITVDEGSDQTFTITPDTGYLIADIQVDGISQEIENSFIFENVEEAHTITVSFEAIQHVITSSSTTGGSIDPEGTTYVNEGSSMSYGIVAESGYRVNNVTVDGDSQGAISSYEFTEVDQAHSISAVFEVVPEATTYTITASGSTGGTVSPVGPIQVMEGESQAFVITADQGFEVGDIFVDGEPINAVDSYTFEAVDQDHTLEVVFAEVDSTEVPDSDQEPSDNDAPVAIALSDVTESFAPLSVNFDGSQSTDDKAVVGYSWNFGDGSADVTGAEVNYTYSEPGVYTATLTVTDESGNSATDTVIITVNAQEPDTGGSNTDAELRLFPNPASVEVNLGYTGEIELENVYIYSMEGRLMRSYDANDIKFGRDHVINVTMLSDGLYFISAEDVEGNEYQKQMIIQRKF